jgi:hypothetical protein
MARTVTINGSDEVMAMYGIPGTFYRGKWEKVRVTQIGVDEDTPLEVRKSLVGLVIPTIFTKERIEEQTGVSFPIPKESRLAYSPDVIDVLKSAGRHDAAKQLEGIAPNPLDMYVLERETFELV